MQSSYKQIILNQDGSVKYEKMFTLQDLNDKIIPTSQLYDFYNKLPKSEWVWTNITTPALPGEEWKEYPPNGRFLAQIRKAHKVKISNKGRVMFDGKIIKQRDHGYMYLRLDYDGAATPYVWQLIADTWLAPHPDDGQEWGVHHISNDAYNDNIPENLIWLPWDFHKRVNHRLRE